MARQPPQAPRIPMFRRDRRPFHEFSRFSHPANDGIDPHFHTCKKFVHAKAFVQEATAAFRTGHLVYIPSCSPLDMDRVKKTVNNYYRTHEFEPNLEYLYECRQNIDKKHKTVTRLQDAFYFVAMEAFAKKFEAVNEKYKRVLNGSDEVTAREDSDSEDTKTAIG